MEGEERLGRLALEYLSGQIEEKNRCRQWGEITVKLLFQDGKPAKLQLLDDVTVRPKDLRGDAAETDGQ